MVIHFHMMVHKTPTNGFRTIPIMVNQIHINVLLTLNGNLENTTIDFNSHNVFLLIIPWCIYLNV